MQFNVLHKKKVKKADLDTTLKKDRFDFNSLNGSPADSSTIDNPINSNFSFSAAN